MNRRSFFSSIGAIVGAASLSPNIFIPKFEAVRWKVNKDLILRSIRNPEWVKAGPESNIIFPVFNGKNYFGEWCFVDGSNELLLR